MAQRPWASHDRDAPAAMRAGASRNPWVGAYTMLRLPPRGNRLDRPAANVHIEAPSKTVFNSKTGATFLCSPYTIWLGDQHKIRSDRRRRCCPPQPSQLLHWRKPLSKILAVARSSTRTQIVKPSDRATRTPMAVTFATTTEGRCRLPSPMSTVIMVGRNRTIEV
jgi:hypothetical protein